MPTEITVRAIPAPGHNQRWRAGVPWTKVPRRALVVDKPRPVDLATIDNGKPIEISPAQWIMLQDDPRIVAVAHGTDDPQVPTLQGGLAAAQAEILSLRKRLSDAAEAHEKEGRKMAASVDESGSKLAEALAEAVQLRAQLAKRRPG